MKSRSDFAKQWAGTLLVIQRSMAQDQDQAKRAEEIWEAMTKAIDVEHLMAICDLARPDVRRMSMRNQHRMAQYRDAVSAYLKEEDTDDRGRTFGIA